MSKFKVGDKVKIIKIVVGDKNEFKKYIGRTYKIEKVDINEYWLPIEGLTVWQEEELELVQPKQFTKADLKERWLVKLRNGKEYVFDAWLDENDNFKGNFLLQIERGKITGKTIDIKDYYDNLKHMYNHDYDIVEVFKPRYESIWKREEEPKPKKMTVAEIQKELGYKVEIIE